MLIAYICRMERIENAVLIQGATLSDIERMVDKAVARRMEEFVSSLRCDDASLVRRKDAASMLGVSLPTLDAYARSGILHPRHIGGRVFYDSHELFAVKGGRALYEHVSVP